MYQSELVSTSKTITVSSNFEHDYIVEILPNIDFSGSLKFNSSSNTSILLQPEKGLKFECKERIIDSIILTVSAGIVLINILSNNQADLKIK